MSYLLLTGHLSVCRHSEWNAGVNTLNSPQLKGGKWHPQVHAVTYIYMCVCDRVHRYVR